MSTDGIPHRPNPPTARVEPSGMSATASAADAITLSTGPSNRGLVGRSRLGSSLAQFDDLLGSSQHGHVDHLAVQLEHTAAVARGFDHPPRPLHLIRRRQIALADDRNLAGMDGDLRVETD